MTITVVGKKITLYTAVCTDTDCNNILEFDSSDIKHQTISCMGRDAGTKKGITCPDCAQIITPEHFVQIQKRTVTPVEDGK